MKIKKKKKLKILLSSQRKHSPRQKSPKIKTNKKRSTKDKLNIILFRPSISFKTPEKIISYSKESASYQDHPLKFDLFAIFQRKIFSLLFS